MQKQNSFLFGWLAFLLGGCMVFPAQNDAGIKLVPKYKPSLTIKASPYLVLQELTKEGTKYFPLYYFIPKTVSSWTYDSDTWTAQWQPLFAAEYSNLHLEGAGFDYRLGTALRKDCECTQVTYAGWPLYRYTEDDGFAPGTEPQAEGELAGVWATVSISKSKLKPLEIGYDYVVTGP